MARRLRIFVGPVNADDIEASLRGNGYLSLEIYKLSINDIQFINQFKISPLFELSGGYSFLQRIRIGVDRGDREW